jgi:hypothetical protein
VRTRTAGLTAVNVDRALTDERSLAVTWLNRGTRQQKQKAPKRLDKAKRDRRQRGAAASEPAPDSELHPSAGRAPPASLHGSGELGVLVERLADPGDVAVAKDPEAAAEELMLHAVPLDVLRRKEADDRLRRGEPRGSHQTSVLIASSSC